MTADTRTAAGSASDATLVERASAGDANAFERLIDVRLDRAYRTALAIVRTDWDARDACQDAFVAAWRELPRLRDKTRFDQWLDRIVVNECRMLLRRRRSRVREIPIDEFSRPEDHPASPSPVEGLADVEVVREAFGRLSADQRMLLALHHGEGRPVAEIASLVGAPSGTVMWRLFSARRALEKALREVSG
jgi:RNA polymerase sigma-70 factor, ECF subfamily